MDVSTKEWRKKLTKTDVTQCQRILALHKYGGGSLYTAFLCICKEVISEFEPMTNCHQGAILLFCQDSASYKGM